MPTTLNVPQRLIVNTKIYICAEKWDIPKLKTLSAKKFKAHLAREGNSSSFSSSLGLMYEETPENDRLLKDVAIKYAADNYPMLVKLGEFGKLCRERGNIAFEILQAIPAQGSSVKEFPGKSRKSITGGSQYVIS